MNYTRFEGVQFGVTNLYRQVRLSVGMTGHEKLGKGGGEGMPPLNPLGVMPMNLIMLQVNNALIV